MPILYVFHIHNLQNWSFSRPLCLLFFYLQWMGFRGLEVVSAVLSVVLIYILTTFLLYEAVQRTVHQDFNIDGDIMLITAAGGVAINLM